MRAIVAIVIYQCLIVDLGMLDAMETLETSKNFAQRGYARGVAIRLFYQGKILE